jgi:hypothetical protein
MNLIHLLVVTLTWAAGIVLVSGLRPIWPDAPIWAPFIGVIAPLSLTWPILRALQASPVLVRCPICGQLLGGEIQPEPRGLAFRCQACQGVFVLLGKWTAGTENRHFQFDRKIRAVLLDAEGREVGRKQARWPYFVVRWKTSRS